jgi:hypothetical protein
MSNPLIPVLNQQKKLAEPVIAQASVTGGVVLALLGGVAFLRKTGANRLHYFATGLTLAVPTTKVAGGIINAVDFTKATNGTYTVRTYNTKGNKTIASNAGVVTTASGLPLMFTHMTGIAAS